MPPDRKEAAEKLRQLVNSNLKNEIEVSVSYDISPVIIIIATVLPACTTSMMYGIYPKTA